MSITSIYKSNIGQNYDKGPEEFPEGFPEELLTALDEVPSG